MRCCGGGGFQRFLFPLKSGPFFPPNNPPYLKPSEPLYPCTAVDRKYKPACFDLQTSYALGAVQGDFAKVFSLCAAVGVPFRLTCYQSLGRDAAATSLNQVPGTVARCALGTGQEQRANCIT